MFKNENRILAIGCNVGFNRNRNKTRFLSFHLQNSSPGPPNYILNILKALLTIEET